MNPSFRLLIVLVVWGANLTLADDGFRVLPYIQNPAASAMTIKWFSRDASEGIVTLRGEGTEVVERSSPIKAEALRNNPFKPEPGAPHPEPPYAHRVRFEGLVPGQEYRYEVKQGATVYSAAFRTAPPADQPVRLIAYADSEAEPESSELPAVDWAATQGSGRPETVKQYLVNQTEGYRANLEIIAQRRPNLILVAGDLVETGGEQRDWDEFWRHNAGEYGAIASTIPLVTALGNHENFAGPGGGYTAEGANFATEKFRTYFEFPDNGAGEAKHRGRFYRIDYGPLTIVTLDSSDGLPAGSASDTNHNLSDSDAPDFNPGSYQHRWFEAQLADAQKRSKFTIVQFHHTMYGSGPHSIPFGQGGFSGQSGIAMQVLTPMLHRYGVDLVVSGHNEIFERSEIPGEELLSDGKVRPRVLQAYDVGVGGDGLRAPSTGAVNPFRKFIPHFDSPEVWEGGRLRSGGKHYGHLEINATRGDDGRWALDLTPVYCLPVLGDDGTVAKWERMTYPDPVRIEE